MTPDKQQELNQHIQAISPSEALRDREDSP
jgi:hypothetical protein